MEVAIQNFTQWMANLVKYKQAAGAPGLRPRGVTQAECRSTIVSLVYQGDIPVVRSTNMCGLRCCFSWGYQVPVFTGRSVPLAWGWGQGVFHSTVGDSYSQGRVVEPHKEGYPVYGASQPRSNRVKGHFMNFTPFYLGEVSDWVRVQSYRGTQHFLLQVVTSLVVLVRTGL